MTENVWRWVLSGSALILVVVLVRGLLGKRISAGLRYGLWTVVLVRLLVPVPLFDLSVTAPQIPAWNLPEAMEEKSIYVLPIQSYPVEEGDRYGFMEEDGTLGDVNSFGYARLEDGGRRITRYADKISLQELLSWIWAAGIWMLGMVLAVSNLRFSIRLRRVRRPLEGTAAPVPVYVASALPSPCLAGLFRPAVYVTAEAAADPVMLRHVLAHELTHYNHRDHLWSVLRCAALAMHWWNPLAWLAAVYSRRDGELACDEGALRQLGDGERAAYGETLLTLVTARGRPADLLSFATTMSGEKRSLRERIQRIAGQPKQLVSAMAAVIAVLTISFLVAFGQTAGGKDPAAPQHQAWNVNAPVDSQEQTTKGFPEHPLSTPTLSGSRKEGVYTFLLVGVDAGNSNMDTIMLIAYDAQNQDVSIMSIPRDTVVNDGQKVNAIKYVYSGNSGSVDALKESVRTLVGFVPDYYMKIDLNMLVHLVDLLGGVKFDVPQDMDYDDPHQDLHIHLRRGVQTLNGEQAMGLVRFRRYKEGDIKRVSVQQDFIKALIKECLSIKHWDKITTCINLVLENVETDLQFESAAWFAANALGLNSGVSALKAEDVYTCTMPGDYWGNLTQNQYGILQSVIVSYPDQVAEEINNRFNPYKHEIALSMLEQVSIAPP